MLAHAPVHITNQQKRMPLRTVDKLIAAYKEIGNGQKICADAQTTPRQEQKLTYAPAHTHMVITDNWHQR